MCPVATSQSCLFQGCFKVFFPSSRGVRQGDPLSPFLFIMASEVLSRGLIKCFEEKEIAYFSTPRKCTPVSHLLYADDTLIFMNGKRRSIVGCKNCIMRYCLCSGQRVNVQKSSFYISKKTSSATIASIHNATGFSKKLCPFKYLGAPISEGRGPIFDFEDLLKKVKKKVAGWKNSLLSHGARLILMKHTLASMPIYLLSSVYVPKRVLHQLKTIMTDFFWGEAEGKVKRKWVSWDSLCLPLEEGGLGLRDLTLMSYCFRLKSLWRVLSSDSLWACFMRHKYLNENTPLALQTLSTGASMFWKECFRWKETLLDNSSWEIGHGKLSLIYENWSGLGRIEEIIDNPLPLANLTVKEGLDCHFNFPVFPEHLLLDLRSLLTLKLNIVEEEKEKRYWIHTTNGDFTVASAYEFLRPKRQVSAILQRVWSNFIPTKVSIFSWRLLHEIVPADMVIRRLGIPITSKCVCCVHNSECEELNHLFLLGELAQSVWKNFSIIFKMDLSRVVS